MPNKKQQFGKKGESLAARHLKRSGYRIIEKNYRTKQGEIDIIAKDKDTIVFVEVFMNYVVFFNINRGNICKEKSWFY